MNIMVMNAGSSSQKCCLYRIEGNELPADPPSPVWSGKIEWTAPGGAAMTVKCRQAFGEAAISEFLPPDLSRRDGVHHLLQTLVQGDTAVLRSPGEISVVGHRIVHGGADLGEPTRVTEEVKAIIERLAPLAPEHNPAAREGIEAAEQFAGPDAVHIAVFDTAFHRTIPDAAAVYAGPYSWVEQGIRRYGFHGINHGWCAERAVEMLPEADPKTLRLITCHLGNGCSLAAVRGGNCVDTTMGFTPMEGLMMGSRSGSIDPGVLLYLLGQPGVTPEELGRILNEESGLRGLSGISEDVRTITAAIETGSARARLALDVYIHRLRWHIGAMTASLGGLDVLVFTAGVGENSPTIRYAACESFTFLGLVLDEEKNRSLQGSLPGGSVDISRPDSRVRVLVIPANEDWAVARDCWRLAGAFRTPD